MRLRRGWADQSLTASHTRQKLLLLLALKAVSSDSGLPSKNPHLIQVKDER